MQMRDRPTFLCRANSDPAAPPTLPVDATYCVGQSVSQVMGHVRIVGQGDGARRNRGPHR